MITRQDIFLYADEQYGTKPEYLWESYPDAAVLRHGENPKWYGLVMTVARNRLGLPGEGSVELLTVKCDPLLIGSLLQTEGYLPAYHMNKDRWISIRLDGSVSREDAFHLLDLSFDLTRTKLRKRRIQPE